MSVFLRLNPFSQNLGEFLGVPAERARYLINVCFKAYADTAVYPGTEILHALAVAQQEVNTYEEMVLCAHCIGCKSVLESMRQTQIGDIAVRVMQRDEPGPSYN